MKVFYKIKKCRVCGNNKLKNIIDLNKQYIQGSFIKKNNPKPYLKKIPLLLVLCPKCFLVQLSHTVRKEILYKNYWYESGINHTMRSHLQKLTITCSNLIKKKEPTKVLDIGCNDGTLLNFYSKRFKKYGIDPSQITKKIKKKDIHVINDFFPPKKKNALSNLKFDLITSIAMFYDLQNPNIFVKKIKKHLEKDGIWIFELSYLLDMIKLNSFDTICHEHLEYYSLHSLTYLMNKHDLKIFNVSKNTINGGSIRCFVTHKNNIIYDDLKKNKKLTNFLLKEKKLEIKKLNIYKKFNKKIFNIKKRLRLKIDEIILKNKKVYVLGASTKGNTILQYLNIDSKITPYAIERNKQKIGAKTIGSNIKIISEDAVKNSEPDYKLVLPWHFKSEIISRELKYIKKGGKLIFPLPRVLVIDKKNYLNHVK
ncbi:class I SAM-dependent methyltransferase [Candidatus Pelagibacter sp.]|uniref:class I SAM-dependent methyltransferase n=1 Tax=Candidatus Pelagibacter sp. TaxID=2024849 RepID=UPI003F8424B0